ncbi:MAG: hypothetical protein HFG75_12490 [Hungatella sp.]|nr:hypothetical protein [Hungatella sp.]
MGIYVNPRNTAFEMSRFSDIAAEKDVESGRDPDVFMADMGHMVAEDVTEIFSDCRGIHYDSRKKLYEYVIERHEKGVGRLWDYI